MHFHICIQISWPTELFNPLDCGPFLIQASKPGDIEKLMGDLDHNKDQTVDFQEYMTFMATLTMVCHEFFKKA